MTVMASQITSLRFVYLTFYSGADQRKHQSSVSLTFVWGIHRWPVNSPHKRPVSWYTSVSTVYTHGFVVIFDKWTHMIDISHDEVIKWKHSLRYRSFVRGIHLSPVNSQHKRPWCGTIFFDLRLNKRWADNPDAGDLRHHRAHYDVTVMGLQWWIYPYPYPL